MSREWSRKDSCNDSLTDYFDHRSLSLKDTCIRANASEIKQKYQIYINTRFNHCSKFVTYSIDKNLILLRRSRKQRHNSLCRGQWRHWFRRLKVSQIVVLCFRYIKSNFSGSNVKFFNGCTVLSKNVLYVIYNSTIIEGPCFLSELRPWPLTLKRQRAWSRKDSRKDSCNDSRNDSRIV